MGRACWTLLNVARPGSLLSLAGNPTLAMQGCSHVFNTESDLFSKMPCLCSCRCGHRRRSSAPGAAAPPSRPPPASRGTALWRQTRQDSGSPRPPAAARAPRSAATDWRGSRRMDLWPCGDALGMSGQAGSACSAQSRMWQSDAALKLRQGITRLSGVSQPRSGPNSVHGFCTRSSPKGDAGLARRGASRADAWRQQLLRHYLLQPRVARGVVSDELLLVAAVAPHF